MSTWGLNTGDEAVKKILDPSVTVEVGKSIRIQGVPYIVNDVRLFDSRIWISVNNLDTGEHHLVVTEQENMRSLPANVVIIRPTDRRRNNVLVDRLPF